MFFDFQQAELLLINRRGRRELREREEEFNRPLAKINRTGSPAHQLMKRIFATGLIKVSIVNMDLGILLPPNLISLYCI